MSERPDGPETEATTPVGSSNPVADVASAAIDEGLQELVAAGLENAVPVIKYVVGEVIGGLGSF